MNSLLQDLRYALRTLLKKPAFTVVAVLTLGLGIGANTAIFSVVNSVVFRQLPYREPERLVQLFTQFPGLKFDRFWFSPPEFFDLREQAKSYESIGGWVNGDAAIVGGNEPVRVSASYTTGQMLQTVGVMPDMGSLYEDDATLPGASPVALIGHGLWQKAFGGDPQVLGKSVEIDGVKTEIIGILPRTFDFPDRSIEIWLPLTLDPAKRDNRGSHYLGMVGRLKPGVTIDQARTELGALMAWSEREYKDTHSNNAKDHPLILASLKEELVGDTRPGMLMLLGAVGFVLLIACANVANLLLARAEARHKEIAIRTALGAGRRRLLQQFLTESLVLGLLGGALGLVLARWGLDLILAVNPDIIPRVHEIGIDLEVLGYTLLLSLATGLIFGLAPVFYIGIRDLHASLKSSGRGSTEGRDRQVFRRGLVIAEVALAVVLVVGSGLMIRSFASLLNVDPGFDPARIVTMQVSLDEQSYPKNEQVLQFYDNLQERLRALPGVEGATVMAGLPPMRRINANDIEFVGIEQPKEGEGPIWNVDYWQTVGDHYFETMGIRLVRGRLFDERDREGAAGVVLVNEAMARRFWPGRDPVGMQLKVSPWRAEVAPQTIVGIVADVKQQGLDQPTGTEVYMAMHQTPAIIDEARRSMNIVVRAKAGDPIALVPSIRALIRSMDANLPLASVRSMDEVFQSSVARPWFLTLLLGCFAAVALVLAAIGIYGVLSFAVAQRTNEIGIRMALGAQRSDVLRLVVGQGLSLALVGVGIGLAAALAVTRLMQSLLFGVSATDPLTFGSVAVVLVAVALAACTVPARRATKVEPVIALRYE